MIPLDVRVAALGTMLNRLKVASHRAGDTVSEGAYAWAESRVRELLDEWHRDTNEAPRRMTNLLPNGMPLMWRHGVHQAFFADAFHCDCILSEGINHGQVIFLGRKDHAMALTRHTAALLLAPLQRFVESGGLPIPAAPEEGDYCI